MESVSGQNVTRLTRRTGCARAAGCRAIFIERAYKEGLREAPAVTVANLNDGVSAVLRDASLRELLAFGACRLIGLEG